MMTERHRNLVRTYWWNKAQLVGLMVVIAATAIVAATAPLWYLAIWIACPVGTFILLWKGDSVGFEIVVISLVVIGLIFVCTAPTWVLRGTALFTAIACFFGIVYPGFGMVSLEAFERVEHHFQNGHSDRRFLQTVVCDSYCYRRGAMMSLCRRLGRREARELVRELR